MLQLQIQTNDKRFTNLYFPCFFASCFPLLTSTLAIKGCKTLTYGPYYIMLSMFCQYFD